MFGKMKHYFALPILALLLAMVPARAAYADYTNPADWSRGQRLYVCSCEESISLRRAPSVSAEAITQIPLHESVFFSSWASDGFCLVDYQGKSGYVLGYYLDWEEPEIAYCEYLRVVNCKESITLRRQGLSDSPAICQIPLGAVVYAITGPDSKFCKVQYNGQTGYVLSAYLSK